MTNVSTWSLSQITGGLLEPGSHLNSNEFTYSIAISSSNWSGYSPGTEPFTGYGVLSNPQTSAFKSAIKAWDELIAPNFAQISENGGGKGSVRVAFTSYEMDNSAGYAYLATPGFNSGISSDIWINSADQSDSFSIGTYGYQVFLHEIGHALGLKHPFEGTALPAQLNDTQYTVMAYDDPVNSLVYTFSLSNNVVSYTASYVNDITPMVADIAAIQSLYGADPNTNSGDTIYVFSQSATYRQSIYDAGGIDTLDLSTFTRPVIIDLNDGAYSSLGYYSVQEQVAFWQSQFPSASSFISTALTAGGTYTWTDNLGIAVGTDIENATGGSGNDTLTGNELANTLHGGDGNDTLSGGLGDDFLSGGAGADALDGGDGNDEVFGDDGDDFVSGGNGNDTLWGLYGDDRLAGDDGADILDGGPGADVIDGGNGDDRIFWDAQDTDVQGGLGNDILIIAENHQLPTGFDLEIHGFEAAQQDIHDSGTNLWSWTKNTYNGLWHLVQQDTSNDDGSRVVVDLDPEDVASTTQVWTVYDTQGQLDSIDQIFDAGGHTFTNFDQANASAMAQDWFVYDSQNRLDNEDVYYDDGTRTFINVDEDGSKSWSQDWFAYDAQARLSSEDVLYDDGSRTFINLDEASNQSWSQDWFAYDNQGRLSSEDVFYDNGTRTYINLDEDNSQVWSQAWFTYDSQGRLDTQDVFYDDGTRIFYNYDEDSTQSFVLTAFLYDNVGHAYQQIIQWDNGTTDYINL